MRGFNDSAGVQGNAALKLNAAAVATIVIAFPVLFAVGFPYAQVTLEIGVMLLWVLGALALPYSTRFLVALPLLAVAFLAHLTLLRGVPGETLALSTCAAGVPRLGLDPVAAMDTFRRAITYIALGFVAVGLSASPMLSRRVMLCIAVSGGLLLALGLLAPVSTSEVLWHFRLPTHGRDWSSFAVDPLLSSMFAYARPYDYAGIPLVLDELQVSRRAVGPILNPNQYAAVVGTTIPMMLAFLADWMERRRVAGGNVGLAFVGLVLCGVVYWITGSTGGTAALIAGVLAFLAIRNHWLSPRQGLLASTVVVGISIAVPLALWALSIEVSGGRLSIWRQAMERLMQSLVLGYGLGGFADLRVDTSLRLFTPWYAAHNIPLQILVEIGLLGTILCLGLAALLRRGARADRNTDVYDAGLAASLVFSIFHACVDYSPGMPFSAVITAVVAGLLCGRRNSWTRRSVHAHVGFERLAVASPLLLLGALLIASSFLYSVTKASEGRLRELAAIEISGITNDGTAIRLLALEVDRVNARCRVTPASRSMLLALAYSHIVLWPTEGDSHLVLADELLRRHQGIARVRPELVPTQAAIRAQLELQSE